jgi:DNA-binding phage protein
MSTLKVYKSYNFVNKDPIIDEIRGMVKGYKYSQIEEMSGVSHTTLRGWFDGKTRRPQYSTVMAVVHALGFKQVIVKRRGKEASGNVVSLKRRAVS